MQEATETGRAHGTPPNCHCDIGTNRTLYREPHRIAIGVKANVHSTELELQSAQKQPNPYQTTNWHRRQTSRTIVSACTTAGQIFTNITLTTLTRKGASSHRCGPPNKRTTIQAQTHPQPTQEVVQTTQSKIGSAWPTQKDEEEEE